MKYKDKMQKVKINYCNLTTRVSFNLVNLNRPSSVFQMIVALYVKKVVNIRAHYRHFL